MTEQSQLRIFDVLDLETIDRDIFRGREIPSRLARTYGGGSCSPGVGCCHEDRI